MRDLGDRSFEPGEDVGTGVVADGAGEHPSDVHVGQVQGVGELAFERRTAMGDGVALEEPRLRLDLIAGPANLDRIELRSSGEGFVVDTPDIWSLAFAVFR